MKIAQIYLLGLLFCVPATADDLFTPRQAVERAAEIAPGAVSGVFVMTVRAAGRQEGVLFLNSEQDYRDPRCLTVEIPMGLARALEDKYGALPDTFLIGKKVALAGYAQRVKIAFFSKGEPTEKYYYQTHLRLASPDQLQLLTVQAPSLPGGIKSAQ
jgi:hypothetical protein